MKVISAKRNKTDADHEELGRIEFLGGLYMGEEGPIIPPAAIRKMIIEAARKRKEGKLAEVGVFILASSPLVYDGPRDPDQLWEVVSFRDRRIVVIGRNRVMRTRPIFNQWEAFVNITYDDEIVKNVAQLDLWMEDAGQIVGLHEMRPMYGRFEIVGNGHK